MIQLKPKLFLTHVSEKYPMVTIVPIDYPLLLNRVRHLLLLRTQGVWMCAISTVMCQFNNSSGTIDREWTRSVVRDIESDN